MNRKHLIINLIGILLVAFTVTGFAANNKPSVAVLDFESIGTEAYLGKAVSEIMRTALVSNQNYTVVERAKINEALSEQTFQKSGLVDDNSAVEIGKVVGANLVIVGSVVKIGNAFTINSRMIDVKTGAAKLGKNVTGTDLNLLTSMSNELVENLFSTVKTPTKLEVPSNNVKVGGHQYIGCYKDQGDPNGVAGRDLLGLITSSSSMTTELCVSFCKTNGFSYAGTQYGSYCFCGNTYGKSGTANNCNMVCTGNQNQICGGIWSNNIYQLK
jgi:curli biogenesis system outer membrane secretion channel CsgG